MPGARRNGNVIDTAAATDRRADATAEPQADAGAGDIDAVAGDIDAVAAVIDADAVGHRRRQRHGHCFNLSRLMYWSCSEVPGVILEFLELFWGFLQGRCRTSAMAKDRGGVLSAAWNGIQAPAADFCGLN